MQITEISASVSRTIQLVQYEPVQLFAAIKAEVKEDEDLGKAYEECFGIVRDEISKRVEKLQNAKKNGGHPAPKPDTPLPTEDGTYIVYQGGVKRLYTRKLNYPGQPQEKLREIWAEYTEGSVECSPENVTADLTT